MNLYGLLSSTTPSTFTVSALLDVVGDLWTAFIGYIADVVSLISSNPLLLFVMAIPFATIGFSLFGRLIDAVRKVG